jgi:uncharacterized membrane protein
VRALLAGFFIVAGVLHFVFPGVYLRVMPPYLPAPLALVYISGACEIAGGIGVLVRSLRRYAGWGLVALLIAVFPANVYMAMNHIMLTPWLAWARLPLQGLLIWWVVRCTQ